MSSPNLQGDIIHDSLWDKHDNENEVLEGDEEPHRRRAFDVQYIHREA